MMCCGSLDREPEGVKESLKVGVSGVRGIVGDSFTPQLAAGFAQAFGTFVGQGAVVVGRDTRPSGFMIENAVVAGLQSVGCKPILAGVVPTPTVLRTLMVPPISSASWRVMVVPRPVPPKRRVVDASACAKGSKIRSRCWLAMPMPVSSTSSNSHPVPVRS